MSAVMSKKAFFNSVFKIILDGYVPNIKTSCSRNGSLVYLDLNLKTRQASSLWATGRYDSHSFHCDRFNKWLVEAIADYQEQYDNNVNGLRQRIEQQEKSHNEEAAELYEQVTKITGDLRTVLERLNYVSTTSETKRHSREALHYCYKMDNALVESYKPVIAKPEPKPEALDFTEATELANALQDIMALARGGSCTIGVTAFSAACVRLKANMRSNGDGTSSIEYRVNSALSGYRRLTYTTSTGTVERVK